VSTESHVILLNPIWLVAFLLGQSPGLKVAGGYILVFHRLKSVSLGKKVRLTAIVDIDSMKNK